MDRFPQFSSLPAELQDSIWEAAVPARCPTAYDAQLRLAHRQQNEDDSVGGSSKQKSFLYYIPPSDALQSERGDKDACSAECGPNVFISTLATLLVICRQSSAIARAAYNRCRPSRPMGLHGLSHDIDASSDLVLIRNGWQKYFHSPLGSIRYLEQPKPLRHVAVVWPGPENDSDLDYFYSFNSLAFLLGLWIELDAIYVLVSPEQLQAAEKISWLPEESRRWRWQHTPGAGRLSLATYLERYKHDETRRATNVFQSGQREYYEVNADQLVKAGGLEEVAEFLATAQQLFIDEHLQTFGEDERPSVAKCMVMSWKPL